MFKIKELTFESNDNKTYTYEFKSGINYFEGRNNTGKTEFYNFIDFMLGKDYDINTKDCYKGLIKQVKMLLEYNNVCLTLVRTPDINKNYIFNTKDNNEINTVLNKNEYKQELNNLFIKKEDNFEAIKIFSEENITYRVFTMFNFFDETMQGLTDNFLSKCKDIEYSIRLDTVLNYIFNTNVEEIKNKEIELSNKNKLLVDLENKKIKFSFIQDRINTNLLKLNTEIVYNGNNTEKIKTFLSNYRILNTDPKKVSKNLISELEVQYNAIYEQIKEFELEIENLKTLKSKDEKRVDLLKQLKNLASNNPTLNYLIEPTEQIIKDLNNHISFSDYLIKTKTLDALKKELSRIKEKMLKNSAASSFFSIDDKSKAISNIEEYLNINIDIIDIDQIKKLKEEIKKLKKDIKDLKSKDDSRELKKLSTYITDLYKSCNIPGNFVFEDLKLPGFRINYVKKGNCLQPLKTINDKEYYCYQGSMARHTLIQLCGYLAFLRKLLSDDKCPIVPILVIDHISKSFDVKNKKIINNVLSKALNDIGEENLQIFMFDTEQAPNLGINNKCSKPLVDNTKSGFCPFYNVRS